MDSIHIIDIFGQFKDKGSGHYYTYPAQPHDAASAEWKRYINDPRELPAKIDKPVYAIWCTPQGWWVAHVQKNQNDSRGGFAMAALCLGYNRPTDAAELLEILSQVAARYIDEMKWRDNTLAEQLTQPGSIALTPCEPMSFDLTGQSAYCTYGSSEQLTAALTDLRQESYQQFARIFIIPEGYDINSSRMTAIPAPVPETELPDTEAPEPTDSSCEKVASSFSLLHILLAATSIISLYAIYMIASLSLNRMPWPFTEPPAATSVPDTIIETIP